MIGTRSIMGEWTARVGVGVAAFVLAFAALCAIDPRAYATTTRIQGTQGAQTVKWSTSRAHSSSVYMKWRNVASASYCGGTFGMSLRNSSDGVRFTPWRYMSMWVAAGQFSFGSYSSRYFRVTTSATKKSPCQFSTQQVTFNGDLYY